MGKQQHLVALIPDGVDPEQIHEIQYSLVNCLDKWENLPYSVRRIKLLKTPAEIEARKKRYRKEYSKREKVRAKAEARAKDPAEIKRRKDYAARDDVKKRKREQSTQARAIKRMLKKMKPDLYEKLMSQYDKEREEKEMALDAAMDEDVNVHT